MATSGTDSGATPGTKTVLLTGASSGIGRAAAELFLQRGWNVIATLRSPEKAQDLAQHPQCLCLALDVTQPQQMPGVIAAAIDRFGAIDVLVNNAGYGLVGPFEACDQAQIERQFATNVFGLMAMTRAVLPHFRDRRSGTIVNVASIGGRLAFPLYSPYHATKWAVEGFSDSLQYELRPFNIRVKLIEPGPIRTDFYGRSATLAQQPGLTAYDAYTQRVMPVMDGFGETGSPATVTAAAIYKAAADSSWRLRYPGGGNATALLLLRKLTPDWLFQRIIRSLMKS